MISYVNDLTCKHTCTSKATIWQASTKSGNGQKKIVCRTGHFANHEITDIKS